MIVLVVCLALALWLFARTREDVYSDIESCDFDDPRARLKELEAAFAAGLLTPEEFGRLSEKLGGEISRQRSARVSGARWLVCRSRRSIKTAG